MGEDFSSRPGVRLRIRSSLRTTLFRSSFILLVAYFISSGLGFLFWLVTARLYPASVLGLGAAVYSTNLFLASAATLGLPLGVIRFLPAETDKANLINASSAISALASVVLGIVFLAGIDVWAPGLAVLRSDPRLTVSYLVSLVFFSVAAVLDAAFVAARRAEHGLVRQTLFNLVRVPLPLVVATGLGVLAIMVSWTLALMASVAAALVLLSRLYPPYRLAADLRGFLGQGILGYSLWNQAGAIVGSASAALLPVLVLSAPGTRGGAASAAYFYAAFATASLLYIVPASFATSLFVEGSHPGTSYSHEARRATLFSVAFLAVGILGVVLLGSWVLGFFGADYARESYATLILLALTSPLLLLNTIFTTNLRIAKRLRPLLGISVAASVATLALAYVLLPTLGIWGAALGFVFGQGLSVALFLSERRMNGVAGPIGPI